MGRVHSVKFRALWVDTDTAGVVHFSNYFRYFELAEQDLYNKLGFNYLDLRDRYGVWIPRVEAHCKYMFPIFFNDEVEVQIAVDEIGEKHIKYLFTIKNITKNRISAKGYVVVVTASIDENKSVPIPEEIKEKIKTYFTD